MACSLPIGGGRPFHFTTPMPKILRSLIDALTLPSATQMAERDLADAQRQLLIHQDASEYHDAMVVYLETKIERLETYRQGLEDQQVTTITSLAHLADHLPSLRNKAAEIRTAS